jgi:hypothetical protein
LAIQLQGHFREAVLLPDSEKRLTRIENLLQALTETQVEQQNQFTTFHEAQKRLHQTQERLVESQLRLQESYQRLQGAQQKTEEHLKIVTSTIGRLVDAQERTETRLAALIRSVDRVVERLDRSGR